jgi:exodeoxyribonuclease VII large subunit
MDKIYSISDITQRIKVRLESLGVFALQGEISEIKHHSSGHLYFTLKDEKSVLPCVMWRTNTYSLTFRPEVGHHVIAQGRLSVYPPHGKYQMSVESMQMAGMGNLFEQFEALKAKLRKEGLFEEIHKKAIPLYPNRIVIISSETAAGLQDAERIFSQDAPHVSRWLIPARMQGKGTAESVMHALDRVLSLKDIDLVLIIRGGGSIEDLWEFNSEILARKVFDFPVPVISGIGHETDFTILDFVADVRASTPTNASEIACRGWKEVYLLLNQAEARLATSAENMLKDAENKVRRLTERYAYKLPLQTLNRYHERVSVLIRQLKDTVKHEYSDIYHYWEKLDTTLRLTHPEEILKKGYALVKGPEGRVYTSKNDAHPGDHITVTMHDGDFQGEVINSE